MKVELTANFARPGAAGGPGDILDLDRAEAESLIANGYANPIKRRGAARRRPKADKAPTGNIQKVLDWVGDDPAKAAQALEQEMARAKPRSTLVETLSGIAAAEEE